MAVIREYGGAIFTPAALGSIEKEPLRSHLTTILWMTTRGDALDLCMNSDELELVWTCDAPHPREGIHRQAR